MKRTKRGSHGRKKCRTGVAAGGPLTAMAAIPIAMGTGALYAWWQDRLDRK